MTYAQHNAFTGKRSATFSNARMGCDADGKITGFEFDIAYDHGAYSEMADVLASKGIRFAGYSYNIPHVRAMARAGCSNQTYGAPYRSFGNSQALTLSESIVDMLARKAGIDPFEFRWRNIARPGDLNINSYPFKEYAYEAIMEQMRPHYEAAVARAKAEDTPRSAAASASRSAATTSPVCRATAPRSPWSSMRTAASPPGTAGRTRDRAPMWARWCSRTRRSGSSASTTRTSRSSAATPPPARSRGPRARTARTTWRAMRRRTPPRSCSTPMRRQDGTLRRYDEMVAEGIPTKYSGFFDTTPMCIDLDPNTGVGDPTPEHNYAMFLVEVEVDAATGATTVLAERMVYDIGAVGSVQAVDGQAYGSLTHSTGWALKDQYIDNKQYSNIVKCGFMYADELPDDIVVESVENPIPRQTAAHGSVGCCEVFQSAMQSAILNGIDDAVGVASTTSPRRRRRSRRAWRRRPVARRPCPRSTSSGRTSSRSSTISPSTRSQREDRPPRDDGRSTAGPDCGRVGQRERRQVPPPARAAAPASTRARSE